MAHLYDALVCTRKVAVVAILKLEALVTVPASIPLVTCLSFSVLNDIDRLFTMDTGNLNYSHKELKKAGIYQINSSDASPNYQYQTRNQFKDEKAAGNHGEALVRRELLSLLYGDFLFSNLQTNNMVVNKQNFEIDFVLLVDQVGLVLAEVKYYSGQVKCTNDQHWQQINGLGNKVKQRNASMQVLRAQSLLKQLLMHQNLNRWPIHAVVLFAHENATILRGLPPKRPQTEVLKLHGLPGWFEKQPKSLAIKFSKQDYGEIKQSLKSFEKAYERTA